MEINPDSQMKIRFKGEIGYDNKILDVCDAVPQKKLPIDAMKMIENVLTSY